ncbi:MAG: prepilin-type N-terminal cleavage/methylation domain-containing protein [Phycisphaerae bacterium]|nr:prepilin-type N-terminal cleavage/methylation domain-containing protein [Phycisphaerae bacterium]
MARLIGPAVVGPELGRKGARVNPCAYTLIELLVVLSLVSLLLSLLVPSLVSARQQAKSFVCMNHGRFAAVEFRIFADTYAHGYRGDSEQFGSRFDARDFLESLYEVGEFWESKGITYEAYRPGQRPIICPSAPPGLGRRGGDMTSWTPAVDPREKVSYAMNRRLFRAPSIKNGILWEAPVLLTERILNHPYTPLLFDVDAEAAMEKTTSPSNCHIPFFCTPNVFLENYWFPAMRHRGRMIISFIGGHVVSTKDPMAEKQWDWECHPSLGKKK